MRWLVYDMWRQSSSASLLQAGTRFRQQISDAPMCVRGPSAGWLWLLHAAPPLPEWSDRYAMLSFLPQPPAPSRDPALEVGHSLLHKGALTTSMVADGPATPQRPVEDWPECTRRVLVCQRGTNQFFFQCFSEHADCSWSAARPGEVFRGGAKRVLQAMGLQGTAGARGQGRGPGGAGHGSAAEGDDDRLHQIVGIRRSDYVPVASSESGGAGAGIAGAAAVGRPAQSATKGVAVGAGGADVAMPSQPASSDEGRGAEGMPAGTPMASTGSGTATGRPPVHAGASAGSEAAGSIAAAGTATSPAGDGLEDAMHSSLMSWCGPFRTADACIIFA